MKIKFGKYKGMELFDIAEKDPHYILWLKKENVTYITDDLIKYASEVIAENEPYLEFIIDDDWGDK